MKPNDVRRSVKNPNHERAAGDAPSMGRMARIPGTGLPKPSTGARRKRSGSSSRSKKSKSSQKLLKLRIWIFSGISLVLLGAVGGLLIRTSFRSPPPSEDTARVEADSQVRVVSKFASPSKEAALEFVKEALAVRELEKVAQFYRISEKRHQEVVNFLSGMASLDGEITDYQWLSSIDANGLSLDGVNVVFKGKDRFSNRVAILTPDEFGNWKIDFDAFARTVTPDWKSILDPATQVAVVRVFVAKDSYFNGPFQDEKEWVCYGMATPDNDQVLLGYCKLNSPQEAALQAILSSGEKLKRVTLEIRRVESGEARQFEISKVIAEDWVMTDSPFDANFVNAQWRLPDPMR